MRHSRASMPASAGRDLETSTATSRTLPSAKAGSTERKEADMSAVTELGYIAIGVKDLAAWRRFAAEIVGLEVADEGDPGRCYLRMDYWHHRIIVEEDGSDD